MKFFKRIIALIMSLVIALSAGMSVSAFSVDSYKSNNALNIKQHLMDEGVPVFTTQNFYTIFNIMKSVFRLLTGKWIIPEQKFNVNVDVFLTEVSEYIKSNSGLDFVQILNSLPESNQLADAVTTIFNIDTAEFRKQMYAKRDEYNAQGNTAMSAVYSLIGMYMSVIKECEIYAVQSESDPVIYETYIRITYKDGGQETFYPGLLINTETGECTNVGTDGIVGSGFNLNLSEMTVYATIDSWMRNFGFCLFYDFAASSMPVFFHYNTRRFKFDYNGMEYMIQIWKGNYTVANGGEVGLYCRDASKSGSYYDCANDDQMLNMSMQILHGEEILVDEGPMMHWWVNGFNLSDRMYLPESLTMKFSIDMPDEEMLNAFCESIDNHYMHDVTYTVDGLTVNVVW